MFKIPEKAHRKWNPDWNPGSVPSSNPGSDPGFILSLSQTPAISILKLPFVQQRKSR